MTDIDWMSVVASLIEEMKQDLDDVCETFASGDVSCMDLCYVLVLTDSLKKDAESLADTVKAVLEAGREGGE